MSFRPLNVLKPRVVSQEAFETVSASPSNQLVASGTADATAFERGVTFALIKLESTAPVALQVPDLSEPPNWFTRINLSGFDSDRAPLMFMDGIKILAGGATVNAVVIAVR